MIANRQSAAVGLLASLNQTSPLLLEGYDYWRLVSVFYTDASANIKRFTQEDKEWMYEGLIQLASGATAQDWTDQDASALMPALAARGFFNLTVEAAGSDATLGLRRNGASTTIGQLYGKVVSSTAGTLTGWCDVASNRKVELKVSVAVTAWELYLGGFKLNI